MTPTITPTPSVTPGGLPGSTFFTLGPCRVVDTRNATGAYGGPALVAGAVRTFALIGPCGIPASATSVAFNVAVTGPTTAGNLALYPGGGSVPVASALNYRAGQTRANNAIVRLGPGGTLAVFCNQATGTTHLILDVAGYFE